MGNEAITENDQMCPILRCSISWYDPVANPAETEAFGAFYI